MLTCNLCTQSAWTGPKCKVCPLKGEAHYLKGFGPVYDVDFFCVGESPSVPGVSSTLNKHMPWAYNIEQKIKETFTRILREPKYRKLQSRFTYAIRCAEDKPNKKMRDACMPLFHPELLEMSRKNKPIMIFALGASVLQSLNIKVSGYRKVQGKLLETTLEDRKVIVLPSISKRQFAANPSHYDILVLQIKQFLDAVLAVKNNQEVQTIVPLKELTKRYIYPTTVKEVSELVDHIINYALPGKKPESHAISVDTETNTLFPHLEKLKLLTFVCAWGPGLSTSIPVEHSESPLELKDIIYDLNRLLKCPKPKIFHNAKYDIKVLQRKGLGVYKFLWDTMLAEHLLAESKKGYYDLKSMTQLFLPRYGGYEDEMKAINAKEVAAYTKTLPIIPGVPELKGPAKKLAEDYGYQFVPLKHLNMYGAIDGDVTRQIAMLQRSRIIQEQNELTKKRRELSFGNKNYFIQLAKPGTSSKTPLHDLMKHQVVPVTQSLARMEARGMRVDREYVKDLANKIKASMLLAKTKLLSMVRTTVKKGEDFNPQSVPQLRKILFSTGYRHPETNKLICYSGVIPDEEIPRTDKGAVSTNANFLRTLKNQYDCVFSDKLLEYRALSKAHDTFIRNILALSAADGRMHTTFNIHGTGTGRLSSVDENMQNVPKKIGDHNIKKSFIPTNPDTQVIMNADAKAAEVRVYAAYSQDKNLIKALNDGMDPHSFFSSRILNPKTVVESIPRSERRTALSLIGIDDEHAWNYEDFQNRGVFSGTSENPGSEPKYGQQLEKLRSNIKRVVFGVLYGAAPKKVSSIVGIAEEQGAAIIAQLFKMFPTLEKYIDNTKEKVRRLGCVETFFGRRRRFQLNGMTFGMRNKAERQAVNMLVQSTSSDIIMRVLVDIDRVIEADFGGRLLITVHDSVVAEIPKEYISQMPDFIYEYGVKRVRENYRWMPVPFLWDVEVGPSYGELSSVDAYLAGHQHVDQISRDDYLDHEIKSDFERLAR